MSKIKKNYSTLKNHQSSIVILCLWCIFAATPATAQTTEFTYQGKLTESSAAANGNYDFQFRLFDTVSGTNQIGAVQTRLGVPVSNGIFTVQLDFGNQFNGTDRYLEIRVRNSTTTTYTPLLPRQRINSSPYSVKSLTAETATTAATATNSNQLGGVAANQFVLTGDPRLDGTNFIQNSTNEQPLSNFNVSGNGTVGGFFSAGTLRATSGFNIGANRVLSVAGANNTSVGVNAGALNTGSINAFFGTSAGAANTNGSSNAFFGSLSGASNTTGGSNSFFGRSAGTLNTSGGSNVFFGAQTGNNNTTGSSNTFIGRGAGGLNTSGSNNTTIGADANVSGNNRSFATAIGAGAIVDADNRIVLGRSNDSVSIPGNINVTGNLFVGFGGLNSLSGTFNDIIVLRLTGGSNTAGVFMDDDATIDGDLVVNGTITENGNRLSHGISRNTIDNPLDPTNKTLTLSSIQSPDLVNIYSGNATTDANGEAVVVLPDYVEALNKDFRYQLTVLGTFAQAFVAAEISRNNFKIKTDKPNVKVSWQVTGVRRDAAAGKNRIPVEQNKTDKEREQYLNPKTSKQPGESQKREN